MYSNSHSGWTVRESNPDGKDERFRTLPDRPCGPPCLLYKAYRLFPRGLKRPGRGVNYPPHLASMLKNKYNYTSTPSLGLRGPVVWWKTLFKGAICEKSTTKCNPKITELHVILIDSRQCQFTWQTRSGHFRNIFCVSKLIFLSVHSFRSIAWRRASEW